LAECKRPVVARVQAIEHIRRMSGGSQAHMLRCSDGCHYIVKFQNNSQGRRILANEFLGTLLASSLGLPVPEVAIVDVQSDLIHSSRELTIKYPRCSEPCQPGLCFGSRYLISRFTLTHGTVLRQSGALSSWYLREVENIRDFAGMLLFDKWTCNTDDRQVIFVRGENNSSDKVAMIDLGFCFGGPKWKFIDYPKIGLFAQATVYSSIQGMEDFNPWLGELENGLDEELLRSLGNEIPPDWYANDIHGLAELINRLNKRRTLVRRLLSITCGTVYKSFRNWKVAFERSYLPIQQPGLCYLGSSNRAPNRISGIPIRECSL
jgi:hypothetical protein